MAEIRKYGRLVDVAMPALPLRRSVATRVRLWLGGAYAPYLYIAPFLLVFAAFTAYPIAYSFYVSLHHWAGIGAMRPVGLGNYSFVLTDNYWWSAVATTALLWLMVLPVGTVISLVLAVAWNRARFRGRTMSRVLFLLPTVSSVVAISIVFRILYDETYGPVNVILGALHLPGVPWLTSEEWSKPSIALVRLWESVGLGALFFSAALQNISQEVYDAAAVDGCGPLRQFRFITLPLLARTTLFLVLTGTLAILGMFVEPQLLTGGGPGVSSTTVGLYLYNLVQGLDLGTASAVSFLVTVMMLAVAVVAFTVSRRWRID